jgi:uncharacterized protein
MPRLSRFSSASLSAALLLLAAVFVDGVGAEPLASIPNPRVRNGTWVTDMPGALRADTVARLNQTIADTEKTHGIEMAVVIVQSLDGVPVEEAAATLIELWGMGRKGRDTALLFLWSRGDRQLRVEVGYGLEGVLPDGTVGAILDTYVVPQFKASAFDAGIIAGVDALLAAARRETVALPALGNKSYEADSWLPSWWPLLGAVPVGIGLLTAFGKWRRYRRRRCPQCQAWMAMMPDYEDDAVLQEGQVTEERIGSVEYDVWKCSACTHHFTLRYPKWTSKYARCPQCGNHTKSSTESIINSATEYSEGSSLVLEQCAFCSFTNEYTKTLPRISDSSSSSSSDDSSGGSSFGGGRSGGGGATRGY